MTNRGITLLELIIVVSIIGILAVALGFSYVGWQGAYKVERDLKTFYTDLMDARTRAITRNQTYFADFPAATSYRVIADTNGDGALNNGDTIVIPPPPTILPLTNQKTVEYAISSNIAGTITFDSRGLINQEGTVCLTTTADPDYDCVVLRRTRINMGKLTTRISDGGACDAANCVER
jgi:prepilin-type N-terminal cleavage/methylation domain-containing protein